MSTQTQNDPSAPTFDDMSNDVADRDPEIPDAFGPETNTRRSRPGDWTNLRALITGGIIGALFGAVFAGGYAATSVWLCSSSLNCGHWAPIVIIFWIIWAIIAVIGAIAAAVLNKMYKLFRVV